MNRFALLLALAAFLLPARAQAQIAYAWGFNNLGQLGNNATTNSNVPVAVSTAGVLNGLNITAVAGGSLSSLALANGQVFAWGGNINGQLGINSTTNSSVPVAVSTAGVLNDMTVTAIAAGSQHCMALANGQVYAWGYNYFGQLGNNSTANSSVPVAVTTTGTPLQGQTVTAIAAGAYHSLALASGQVYAWGFNGYGELGNNSTTNSSVPVAVTTTGTPLQGLTVSAIAAGGTHSLALADGQVYAWGYNGNGQLGNNSTTDSSVPVAVTTTGTPLSGLTVTAIAAGRYHSLALANGQVFAWGNNAQGELGNNSTTQSNVPVAVSSPLLNSLTVTQIAAGNESSYALTSTGRLFAWGDNTDGELGIGSSTTYFTTPQEVLPPNGYIWSSIALNPAGFQVVATVVPAPEPGALLLAAGLGLLALRRRMCTATKL